MQPWQTIVAARSALDPDFSNPCWIRILRHWLELLPYYFITHNTHHFTALWILSETTRWARTSTSIQQLTPILINRLSASSTYCDPWQPPCSIYVPDSLSHTLRPSLLWYTSWSVTLHFIFHTFLHPIIVFFAAHAHTILLCCSTEIRTSNPSLSLNSLLGT